METVERDYSPKGVKFFYIYKALAHPETNAYVTPFTQEERLMHVREAERVIGSRITWLCDTIKNDVKHALGDAPNSEFIIDPDGKVVVRRQWSRPTETRRDLERLVGAVEKPTRVDEINVRFTPPPPFAPKGLVPKMQISGNMTPLRIEAKKGQDGEPFYVKLRAEVDADALSGRAGKMYLGFHVDPLYHVHWNNLAAPLRFTMKLADGDAIEPLSAAAPTVKHPADIDPREFLVDVKQLKSGQPIRLKVDYFACSDEEGWCKPISQEYLIYASRDVDGGNARRSGSRGRGGRGRPSFTDNGPNRAGGLGGNRLMGQVVAFDAERMLLTIRDRSRQQTQFQLTKETRIRSGRGRAAGSFEQLERGKVVMLMMEPAEKEGEPQQVRGLMIR